MSCCFRWRAAFCICMALSGVTCSPPPPSATIEAIEAIEPHDEDREGKPVLPHPTPLDTSSGSPGTEATCHLSAHAHNSSHNNNPVKEDFTGQFGTDVAGTSLCSL